MLRISSLIDGDVNKSTKLLNDLHKTLFHNKDSMLLRTLRTLDEIRVTENLSEIVVNVNECRVLLTD